MYTALYKSQFAERPTTRGTDSKKSANRISRFLHILSLLFHVHCRHNIRIKTQTRLSTRHSHNTKPNHRHGFIFNTALSPSLHSTNFKMVAQLLTSCSYNRRRTRIHPHFETDGTMNIHQNSKPKLTSLKTTTSEHPTHKPTLSSSENIAEWPLLAEEKRSNSKELRQSESAELYHDEGPSIFRAMADYDDHEDMMVLKRANPVYESEDEEYMTAPSKRQRTSGETILQWNSHLTEDHTNGFCLAILQHQG